MKKTTRNLLIMLAVLVVLGGTAAALWWLPGGEPEEESSAIDYSVETEPVIARTSEEVASITVKNAEGTYEMLPLEAETEASASSETDSEAEPEIDFTIKGLEDYNLNGSTVTTLAKSLLSINASRNLGAKENLEDFGLSGDGQAKVELHYKSGETDTFLVGNDAGGNTGKYLLKDGSVYVVAGLNAGLLESRLSFLNTSVYAVADLTEESTDSEGSASETVVPDIVYSMKLSGSNFPEEIVLNYDSNRMSSYLITSPVVAESGTNAFSEIITALKSLSANRVAAIGVSKESLAEYGLQEPFAKIEFDMNGEKHVLAVSESNSEGNRFLVADSSDVIYEVAGDTVATWAETSLMQLRMSYIWLPNIKEVNELSLTYSGGTSNYHITRVVNEEKSTEENPEYDLAIKSGTGKEIDYTNYQGFYQQLISIAVFSTDPAEYSGEPVLRAEYGYFDGQEPTLVEFYAIKDQDRYAVELNGGYSGQVRKASVDHVIELIEKLNNNEATK